MQNDNRYENYETLPALKPISAAALQEMELPPLQWVVDNILPVGVGVLAAKPKRGKSFFALDLCLSVCNGYDFLGYKTHPGACLYFDLESGKRRPKDRIEQLLGGRPAPANLYIITREELEAAARETFTDALQIGNGFEVVLSQYLDQHPEIKIVVLDILARVRQDKTSKTDDYERDYRDFGELVKIANKYSVCVLCVMHNTKTEHADPFDDIQGSAGVMGSLDTAFVIQTRNTEKDEAALYIRGRDIDEALLYMYFDNGKWIKRGTAEEIERQQLEREYKNSNVIKTIFYLLEDQDTWTGSAKELITASYYAGSHIGIDPRMVGAEIGRFENLLNAEGVYHSYNRTGSKRIHTFIKEE